MSYICEIVATFLASDTWNADNFGLFYRRSLGRPLCNSSDSDTEDGKSRVTSLLHAVT